MKFSRKLQIAVVVIIGFLAPGAGAAPTNAIPNSSALADHIAEIRRITPPGFTLVVEQPFVVVGDEAPDVVQSRAVKTVKWAVEKLKQDYFENDPETIDIWLFRDKDSYEQNARSLFNETPTTRFGYYSAAHHALIMNISTGGGTLVHEIVHP